MPPVFLLWLVGLLSANLAVINVLPFPPLDGGRAAGAIIQRVSNNRIGEAAERLEDAAGTRDERVRRTPPFADRRVPRAQHGVAELEESLVL